MTKQLTVGHVCAVALCVLMLFVVASFPQPAYAEGGSSDAFEMPDNVGMKTDNVGTMLSDLFIVPDNNDVSYEMLRQMTGPALDDIRDTFFLGGGLSDNSHIDSSRLYLTGLLMKFVAGIAVIFGTILLTYIVIVGFMHSAKSGQFLGEWDSYFLPARMILGFAGAVPTPAFGGLAFVQVIAMVVTLFGIGTANAGLKIVAPYLLTQPVTAPPQGFNPNVSAAQGVLTSFLCQATVNQLRGEPIALGTTTREYPSKGATITEFSFGDCGTFTMKAPSGSIFDPEFVGEGMDPSALNARLVQVSTHAFQQLINQLKPIARNIVAHHNAGDFDQHANTLGTQYAKAVDQYSDSLYQGVVDTMKFAYGDSNKRMQRIIENRGWAVAASFSSVAMNRQKAISNAMIAVAQSRNMAGFNDKNQPSIITGFPAGGAMFLSYYKDADQLLTRASTLSSDLEMLRNIQKTGASDDAGTFDAISQFLYQSVHGLLAWGAGAHAQKIGMYNPMARLRSTGDAITQTVMVLMVYIPMGSWIVDKVASVFHVKWIGSLVNKFRGGGKSSGFVSHLNVISSTFILSIFALGILLGYVIPLLPYALWTIAIISIMIYFVEAYLASPFWAILIAHPKGDDIVGKGGNGYTILATLALKPAFMLVGLVFAIVLFRVGSWFITETALMSFQMTRIGTFPNPLSVLVALGLYVVLHLILAYRVFSLPSELSSAMLRWLGVTDHTNLGERESHSQVIAFGGHISRAPNIASQAKQSMQKTSAAIKNREVDRTSGS